MVDSCDEDAAASDLVESVVTPDELVAQESIQVPARSRPDHNYLDRGAAEGAHAGLDALAGEVTRGEQAGPGAVTSGQIRQVIEAVEQLETQMKEDYKGLVAPSEVSSDVFVPERPVYDNEEYSVQPARVPTTLMLPPYQPHQRPLTLQTVLKPGSRPSGHPRPYRRPVPPEIKLRRPPHTKYGPPPGPHHNKHAHHSHSRPQSSMNRPPSSMPPLVQGTKPIYTNSPSKSASKAPSGPVRGIITGKPVGPASQGQTLNLGQTNIIGSHVVRSHITLPGNSELAVQASAPQLHFTKPGQIILGKPMESPVPLDQQMTQTRPHMVLVTPSPPETPTAVVQVDREVQTAESDLPAVNTGFKPDSVVIESGFKPIIREPLMAAEDRIAYDVDDDDGDNDDAGDVSLTRRRDTDVPDYDENRVDVPPPPHSPSDHLTQSFEPMFIPSPPDRLSPVEHTRQVYSSLREPRPHPVYVQDDGSLFSERNVERPPPDELATAADRVSAAYLPPGTRAPPLAPHTYTTYDGKVVSATSLTETENTDNNDKTDKPDKTVKFSSKLADGADLLLSTPQFGPFRGQVPPEVSAALSAPPALPAPHHRDHLYHSRTTQLKLVNIQHEDGHNDTKLTASNDTSDATDSTKRE